VLAPKANLRSKIVPAPAPPANESPSEDAHGQGAPARISWARLLKHVFDVEVEHLPTAELLERLSHLGLPTRGPPRAPARRVDLFQTI
jgi:hypothetical protein